MWEEAFVRLLHDFFFIVANGLGKLQIRSLPFCLYLYNTSLRGLYISIPLSLDSSCSIHFTFHKLTLLFILSLQKCSIACDGYGQLCECYV